LLVWMYLGERGVGLRELAQAHGEHAGDAECCGGDERSVLQERVLPWEEEGEAGAAVWV